MKVLVQIFLIFALIQVPARAVAALRVLTWDEAVRLAAENNPRVRASMKTVDAAESDLAASKWVFGPSLSGQMTYRRSASTTTTRNTTEPSDNYSADLSLSQSIFNLSDFGSLARARANLRSESYASRVERSEVSRDLKVAYASLSFAQKNIELAASISQRRQRNLELVRLRFEGGRENRGALLLSQAYFEQSKLEQVQAQNSLRVARATLGQLLGESLGEANVFGEVPIQTPPTAVNFVELAKETPQRLQAVAKEEIADAGITSARGQLFPNLGLTASLGKIGDRFFPQNDNWSIGVTLKVPLWSGADFFGLQSAKATAASASYQRKNTEDGVVTQLEEAYAAYIEAEQKEKLEQSFLVAARTRAEIARQKYQNGLLSFDEWDRIENDLIARETSALRSQRDRVTAEAAWELAQGKGVIQ